MIPAVEVEGPDTAHIHPIQCLNDALLHGKGPGQGDGVSLRRHIGEDVKHHGHLHLLGVGRDGPSHVDHNPRLSVHLALCHIGLRKHAIPLLRGRIRRPLREIEQ